MHLSRTHKQRLLFHKSNSLYSIQLETLSCLRNSIPVEIKLPGIMELDRDYTSIPVIGSCNGLLCIKIVIAASKGFLLYNSCTKEYRTIIKSGYAESIYFGYAESIDDYKILRITYTKNGDRVFDVYSLRKDSWISIPSNFDFGFYACLVSFVSFNGAIHFVTYYRARPSMIAAFDLVEDKFKTLPLPLPDFMLNKGDDEFLKYRTNFGHLSGCLCMSIRTDSGSTEFWVMKEYGVTASWTKILTTKSVYIRDLQPLCYLNNNETILVRHRSNLMFWDSKDEEFKDVKIGCIRGDGKIKNVYVESLVSPNRINGFTNEVKPQYLLSNSKKVKFAEMSDIPPPLIVEILSRLPVKALCRFSASACVDGAIHFVTHYYARPSMIAAFDLVEDKFKTIPPPPDFMLDIFKSSIGIGHLGSCLCLSIPTDSTSIELWVMKEYGVSGSWTKILRTKSVDMHSLVPLCYLNNNETILRRRGMTELMFWDLEDEEFKDVEIGCIQDEWGVENVYVESLVSPNCINGLTTEDDVNLFFIALSDDEELLGCWFN
ncbi:hypothetical protein EZV62_006217 [Acer yangbiense]|uniref:F-box associated beta-propeller type 1 domain-containing protein n=1 Tax=Acer yangbiense TaxID=1000413 RepID=A0A5C7ISD8_9ROSI|nr:hypothetical protein EZV62_006217 [Acer yangbiense]